jgi:hypothetical protein
VSTRKCESYHGKEAIGGQCLVWEASTRATAFETLATE